MCKLNVAALDEGGNSSGGGTLQSCFNYIERMCNELKVSASPMDNNSQFQRTVDATPAKSPAIVDSIKEGLGEVVDITHGRWLMLEKVLIHGKLMTELNFYLITGTGDHSAICQSVQAVSLISLICCWHLGASKCSDSQLNELCK